MNGLPGKSIASLRPATDPGAGGWTGWSAPPYEPYPYPATWYFDVNYAKVRASGSWRRYPAQTACFGWRVMTATLVCWKCGAPLVDQPLPMARVAECSACRADLHVCRMCEFYDTRVAMSCREPVADQVQDKERANFCAYFAAKPDAYRGRGDAVSPSARAQLDALFGADAGEAKDNNAKAVSRSEAEIAREQLEQLFGSRKKGDI